MMLDLIKYFYAKSQNMKIPLLPTVAFPFYKGKNHVPFVKGDGRSASGVRGF